MSFTIIVDPKVDAIFRKMWQKDSVRFDQIGKKLVELAENPEIGKPLKKPLRDSGACTSGIMSSCTRSTGKTIKIILVDYAHHDEVY